MSDDALAGALSALRRARGLSVNALADRSGVSRAMIARVERGEAQPTAALLGRITAALGITLSELFGRLEDERPARLVRRAEQPVWTDPGTGYRRRSVSPADGGPLQLIDVELPAGARVGYPADAYRFIHQQMWVLAGSLTFREGEAVHRLEPGDCLALGEPVDCEFANQGADPCRYLVAVVRRSGDDRVMARSISPA